MSVFSYIVESLGKVNFEKSEDGNYYGYKVMTVGADGGLVSGANARLSLPNKVGALHKMPGSGIYMSNNPEYVVDYYSYKEDEEDPDEVVIKYKFNLSDVVEGEGSLGDAEPEIGVARAQVVSLIPIDDWHDGSRF